MKVLLERYLLYKHYIKTFILYAFIPVILTLIFAMIAISAPVNIVIVNSYNDMNPCTNPQVEGFRTQLSTYEQDIHIYMFSLHARLINNSQSRLNYIVSYVKRRIQSINPQIIYTTDDIAFKTIAVTESKKYDVISSGLNGPIDYYISRYHLTQKNHIVFISEWIELGKLLQFLSDNTVYFNRYYIITESPENQSLTAFLVNQNIAQYIPEKKTRIIYVNNVSQLRNQLIQLNNSEPALVILALLKIRDEFGKYRGLDYIIRQFINYNAHDLTVGLNPLFCKSGLPVCIGVNFRDMGILSAITAYQIYSNQYKDKWLKVFHPSTIIAVNQKRLRQLGYSNILNNIEDVNRIYEHIGVYENKN